MEKVYSMATPEPSADEFRAESQVLYAVLFTLVTQINADAVQHDYLVSLVLALRAVPLPASVVRDLHPADTDLDMNDDLANVIRIWTDFEADAPLHPRPEDRPMAKPYQPDAAPWRQPQGRHLTSEAWANGNAFIARLHAAAPDIDWLDMRGLRAMIEAIEQPLSPSKLEDVLPAAACWIVYAGKALKSNRIPYAFYPGDEGTRKLPSSRGELWTGQHAFNDAR